MCCTLLWSVNIGLSTVIKQLYTVWFLSLFFCWFVCFLHCSTWHTGWIAKKTKRVSFGWCLLEIPPSIIALCCNSHGNRSGRRARRSASWRSALWRSASWRSASWHSASWRASTRTRHTTSLSVGCSATSLPEQQFWIQSSSFSQWAICRPLLRLWNGGPVAGGPVWELQSAVHWGSSSLPLQCEYYSHTA